ncbi:cytoplasmic 60S subunit biogenesis factor ZNF622-like isoform X2 [Babylonia areolata]
MEDKVLTCLTCRVAFADLDRGREHYKSEWHRYNTKRKVAQMEPLSAEMFKIQMAAKQEKAAKEKESEDGFCVLCNKAFKSQNALDSHLRSKKHREMDAIAQKQGIDKSQMVTRSTSKSSDQGEMEVESDEEEDKDSDEESWDEGEEVLGLEECLFCSHISSALETNLSHMTTQHSFFLPDAEFISDLEGLVVYLGELISQGHMCLWCQDRSKLFRSVRAVQKHMVDKGHCKMKHDDSSRAQYVDFYDYRSSYPDADEAGEGDETVDPEMLISGGFELVLPSGSTIGHRSLACYYKQNHGGRQQVVKAKTPLSKVLANYKALGWTGATGAAVKQRARDVHYLQRMKQRFSMKVGTKANKMQFHYREQNPI